MHDRHRRRFDLTGRMALVTGSVRGLGFEIARAFAEAGARVAVNGRDAGRVAEATERLAAAGLDVLEAAFDVADRAAAAAWVTGPGGGLDVLVNNVGRRDRRATPELPPEDFHDMLDVSLTAAYALVRAARPGMAAKGGGAVINVTSIAGPVARPQDADYTAAKGGLDALTRSLAMELAPDGIRVNAIAPGFFATEANAQWVDDAQVARFVAERIPMARWGRPEEIAGAAVFLASDAASYVNGHTLVVDAGLSVRM